MMKHDNPQCYNGMRHPPTWARGPPTLGAMLSGPCKDSIARINSMGPESMLAGRLSSGQAKGRSAIVRSPGTGPCQHAFGAHAAHAGAAVLCRAPKAWHRVSQQLWPPYQIHDNFSA